MFGIKHLLAIVPVLAATAAADPAPLPPEAALHKLSLVLRHAEPSESEVAAFVQNAGASADELRGALAEMAKSFFLTQEYRETMNGFFASWWGLPRAETTAMAAYIITQDRPFDEIYDHAYLYVDGSTARPYRTAGALTSTPLPNVGSGYQVVRLMAAETRFRSLFSHLDFLNQFPDTPTNVNRKRANQIFQRFMCESLSNTDGTPTFRFDEDHANNPDCIGCHRRLDPMARFFDRWRPPQPGGTTTWYNPDLSASGAVKFFGDDGSPISLPGEDLVGLAEIIRQLPQATRCLATKVWSFAIGAAIPLEPQQEARLISAFDARRSLNELVLAAIDEHYFWSTADPPAITYAAIRSSLGSCEGCHGPAGANRPTIDIRSYPFRNNHEDNFKLLVRIFGTVSGNPDYPLMPKPPNQPFEEDTLGRMRAWIRSGARDESDHPSLTDDEIKEVLQ